MERLTGLKELQQPNTSQNQYFSFSTHADTFQTTISQPAPASPYSQFKNLFDNPDNHSNHADSGSAFETSLSKEQVATHSSNKREQIAEQKRVKSMDQHEQQQQQNHNQVLLRKTQNRLREMDRDELEDLPNPRDLLAEFQRVRERTLKGLMMKSFCDIVLDSSLQRKNNRKECSTNSRFFGVVTQNNRFSANIHVKLIKKQVYLGSYSSAVEAAFQYDIGHVLLHGLKAKTNFSYSKEAIIEMLATDYLFDVIHKKYYC